MKRVVIFGAGIGGLTVAHELSKLNYKIDIYEKKDAIGGLARSDRDEFGCNREVCWRVEFNFYQNLFRVMREIPLIPELYPNENPNNVINKTVIDNLTKCYHKNINDTHTPLIDNIKIAYNILYGATSCDDRLDTLDEISWADSLDNIGVSTLVKQVAPWLGLDRNLASYNSVIKVGMEQDILPKQIKDLDSERNYVTNDPTSEAWFDHWEINLMNNGVNFHMNSELVSVQIENNLVISAIVSQKLTNNNKKQFIKVYADYFVFGLPVDALAKIVLQTPELNYGQLSNVIELSNTCLHMQPCFQLFMNESISLGKNINSFLITDTPWDLIVLMHDKIFKSPLCYNIPDAKSNWSIAACTVYKPGIVFGKTLRECTFEEIIVELWEQMLASKTFRKIIYENNGFDLTPDMIIKFAPMWPTYYYDNDLLYTEEPKFTNNAGSLKLRPSCKTHIDNLFLATAYCKETINIFSMEAACISGLNTANLIDNQVEPPYMVPRPRLFEPARKFDQFCYDNNLPNISPVLFSIDYLLYGIIGQGRKFMS
jgi:hypothetical protein